MSYSTLLDTNITIGAYEFSGNSISVAEGQTLADTNNKEYTGVLSSILSGDAKRAMNGSTLRLAACEVTVVNGEGSGRYLKGATRPGYDLAALCWRKGECAHFRKDSLYVRWLVSRTSRHDASPLGASSHACLC